MVTDLLHQLGINPREALAFAAGVALMAALNALWWWRAERQKARRLRRAVLPRRGGYIRVEPTRRW